MPGRRSPGPDGGEPSGTARAAALRLLGRRDYTVAELRTRLLKRGFSPDEVSRSLEALVAERLADDRRAAQAHIRTGVRVKGRGRYRLQRELEARGVDAALVSDLLAGLDETDELAAVEQVLARKRPRGPLSMADRRRLFQQLLRRGFAADVIARAVKGTPPDEN